MGQQGLAAGSGTLSAAELAWDLLKEVTIIFIQFSSVIQLCPTLCYTIDCSMTGLPVHHQLLSLLKLMSIESVMPSKHLTLSSPSPPTFNLSHHQGLFQ